jgi:hypothetical protein
MLRFQNRKKKSKHCKCFFATNFEHSSRFSEHLQSKREKFCFFNLGFFFGEFIKNEIFF